MANPARDIVRDTHCLVCRGLFRDPRLLPCAHTVCRHCLLSQLADRPQALCPICSYSIADAGQGRMRGQGWEVVVDALPRDRASEALVQAFMLLSDGHACDGCQSASSTFICLTCRDRLCASCRNIHSNMTATQHHRVEAVNNVVPEQLAADQPAVCRYHEDQPAELFCLAHRAPVCQLCAPSPGHRTCPAAVPLENRANELRRELAQICTRLSSADAGMDRSVRQLDRQLQEANRQGHRILHSISADFNHLRNVLNACQQRVNQEAVDEVTRVTDRVQVARDTMTARREGLSTHRESLDRFQRAMPMQFLSDFNPTLRSQVNSLDLSTQISPDVRAISVMPLTLNQTALDRLEMAINRLRLIQPPVAHASVQTRLWWFHSNHGQNIVLSNHGGTARRRARGYHGVVVSAHPMELNTLYEVRLDEVTEGYNGRWLPCGALLVTPHPRLALPHTLYPCWEHALVFSNAVYNRGTLVQDLSLWNTLWDVPVGSCVGVMLDSARCLHLYLDRMHVIMVPNVPTPCFAAFDLRKSYTKITTLPLTTIPPD